MAERTLTKHQQNSEKTREKIIDAAERLYGSRSIDAVSLREITAAAGQKNPNALQYHFKNRNGLLQAIMEKHSARIGRLRNNYYQRAENGEWSPAEAAARCLVMPVIDYVETNPAAVNFVKINSQITALYQLTAENKGSLGITFPRMPTLKKLFDAALAGIPREESRRRTYLAVNTTFHAISDIYRVNEQSASEDTAATRELMVEQLICLLESFFCAPAKTA